jgi:uncharacterized membrane protein
MRVIKRVTIKRTVEDVQQFWRDLENLPPFMEYLDAPARQGASVWFQPAPADRGTEVTVERDEGSAEQLRDDLRRFKQVMETGEVVLSEGSLEGAGQGARRQRPAQAPDAEEVLR